jgi:hypothetical protein
MLPLSDQEIFEVGIVKDNKNLKLNFLKQKKCYAINNLVVDQSGCQSR